MEEFGTLTITRHTHIKAFSTFETYSFQWDGPSKILISDQVLNDPIPGTLERDGDILTFGEYRVRLVGMFDSQTHIAERIDA
jgi:hypothetical protein